MKLPEIASERLLLTELEYGDADALLAYRMDPEVDRYQSWKWHSIEAVREFIASLKSVELDTPDTWFQIAVRLCDSRNLVGDMGVHFLEEGSDQVEIGFTIAPDFQGRGFATEAVSGLLGFLFESLGKRRIIASVDPRNVASLAVLQRLGMRQEAHFRKSLWFKGEWVDDVIFALLRTDWKGTGRLAGKRPGSSREQAS